MTVWETITERINKLDEQHKDVFAKLEALKDGGGQSFNLIDSIPNYHESINSIKSRLAASMQLFRSLENNASGLSLVPISYLNGLSASLKGMLDSLNTITGFFSNIDANGGLGSINPSNFTAVSANQAFTGDFAAILAGFDGHLDNALDNFYKINFIFQRPDYSALSNITDGLTDILDEFTTHKNSVAKLLEDSKGLKKQIEKISGAVTTELTNAQDANKQIGEMKQKAEAGQKEIADAQAAIAQKIPLIEDAHSKATALKTSIEAYQPQFDQFKKELDQRITKYNEGNKVLEELLKSLREQDTEIKRINAEAAAALNFATVAGLAKGFEDRRQALNTELSEAHTGYKWSVGFLFFSTLFPALYIMGNLFGWWTQQEIKHEQLFTLLLLIIPAAIMTRFTSCRYNSLFRLREQYAHKFSVAFSMEGFKDQLEQENNQKSQLVATTFAQLSSNNPADTIDHKSSSEDHPLPLWNKFLDFVFPKR